jgi:hypothetical protein
MGTGKMIRQIRRGQAQELVDESHETKYRTRVWGQ